MRFPEFETITIAELDALDEGALDQLAFGVIGMNADTIVDVYNATEARLAGLNPAKVLGMPFFESIAQCMNNYLVAQRFSDEPRLDDIIPYVLTLRMKPTRVRMRLMAQPDRARRYVLIER